ncbi:MAG: AAA-like domain-containing protein [Pseudanabaenales cyanobacterium]|nr:AAA-like domain-containing protein [Pseudanabaenales cyanobacterium]
MTADEALTVLDRLLPGYAFSNLQETVFCQVWEGKTYAEIAEDCGYDHSYIRDVGFKLWQLLSNVMEQKVSKSNVRAVLGRYARLQSGSLSVANRCQETTLSSEPPSISHPFELEYPSGPVPLNSNLYIERPPIEALTYTEVSKPGSLIRIKAPRQMGKTSLLRRILAHAKGQDFRTVTLSLHRADRQVFEDLNRFLRWFCANISRQLQVPPCLDDYWNTDIGSKISTTAYFEEYLLNQIAAPLVIALDEVNQVFEHPEISSDFLPLLRSWHEDGKELEIWQKVRWVIVHATDIYVPLKLNQSPFNIGLSIKLPKFTHAQVQDLAKRHSLDWAAGKSGKEALTPLLRMVGCSPGLIRLALYHLSQKHVGLEQLLQEAPTQTGIYGDHLRQHLAALQPHPNLIAALKQVVTAENSVELEPITAYRLESIGLVALKGNRAIPSCELYRLFFREQLSIKAADLKRDP